ncbi:MAG: chemotaxis protein CheD [Deltaproteobacteria bacterium]|nr:chemotaxis protein CheD [Deltaproteobacteria bacterium]
MTTSRNQQLQPIHYHLRPGYIFANSEPSLISVELGSGVVVCLWDKVLGIGGMGHYQFPRPQRKDRPTAKFGLMSVTTLIKMLMKMGCQKENLQAQIFGGGHRYNYAKNLGYRNVKVAKQMLKRSRIPIVSEDVGGVLSRRILFHTRTNEVLCMKTPKSRQMDWYPFYAS